MKTKKTSKIPRPRSKGEEAFALHCRIDGLIPEREYIFASPRKWRFDFAFPDKKLAVEIEGIPRFGFGRHQTQAGFAKDIEKYNRAGVLGWTLLRYTTQMVMSGAAIEEVKSVLEGD